MQLKVGKRYLYQKVLTLMEIASDGYAEGICYCVEGGKSEPWYVPKSDLLPYVEKVKEGDLVRWESEDGLQIVQGIVEEIEDYDSESRVFLGLSVGESTTLMPLDECTIIKKKAELSK